MNIHTNTHYQEVLAFLRPFMDALDVPTDVVFKRFNNYEHDIVRQAFRDRYAAKYKVLVHFRTNKINFEKVPYKSGELKQENIVEQAHALFIASLSEKKDEILTGVAGKDELFRIDAITRDFLLGVAESLEDKNIANDLVKSAIREVLNLDSRDVVITAKDEIFIRKFICLKKKEADRIKDVEQLINLDDVFVRIGMKDTIRRCIDDLTDGLNSFSNPSLFSDNYLNNFMKIVSKILINDGITEERAGIIAKKLFREEYSTVLAMTAIRLLDKISQKNKVAEQFLSWFDGSIDLDEKGKFKRPALVDYSSSTIPPAFIKGIVITMKTQTDRMAAAYRVLESTKRSIIGQSAKILIIQEDSDKIKDNINEKSNEIVELKRSDSILDDKKMRDQITLIDYQSAKKELDLFNKIKVIDKEILEYKKDIEKLSSFEKEAKRVLDGFERNSAKAEADIKGIDFAIQEPKKKYDMFVAAIAKAIVSKKIRI